MDFQKILESVGALGILAFIAYKVPSIITGVNQTIATSAENMHLAHTETLAVFKSQMQAMIENLNLQFTSFDKRFVQIETLLTKDIVNKDLDSRIKSLEKSGEHDKLG